MKREHLMNEIEKCIEDSGERSKILEGLFGYILTCTQVINISSLPFAIKNGLFACSCKITV